MILRKARKMLATIKLSLVILFGQVRMRQEHWSSVVKLVQQIGAPKPRKKNLNLKRRRDRSVGLVTRRKVHRNSSERLIIVV